MDDGQIALKRAADDADVVRRLAAHVRDHTTDLGDDTVIVPPEVYTDPARWEAERREIFQKLPLLACLSRDVAQPGDVYLFDEAGPSIVIVRAKDGTVNAFLNMCTHRATKLVRECGHVGRMTCPFHGWTFNLDGKLIGVPRKEAFDPEQLKNRDLYRVPVGEWGGMIFVKASPGDERIDVPAWLGSYTEILEALDLGGADPVKAGTLHFQGNWKYALDTYGEGYHIGALHKNTVGAMYYGDIITVQRHGLHYRMSFAPNAFAETVGKDESEWPPMEYSPVCQIFPNVAINRQPMPNGRAFVTISRVFPGKTMDTGFSVLTTYKAGGMPEDDDLDQYRDGHDLIMKVVGTEDFAIVPSAYQNLRTAPAGYRSVFGRQEHPASTTQRLIADMIGMPF